MGSMGDPMLARGDAVGFCVSEALLDITHGNAEAVANALRQRIHLLEFSLQPCSSSSSDSQMHFPFSVLSAGYARPEPGKGKGPFWVIG